MLVHQDLSFSHSQQILPHNGLLEESTETPLSPEELETNTIARLASQHHASEYSCTKFGPNGCPVRYVPLSIQAPEVFQELRNRQMQCSHIKTWWHSDSLASQSSPAVPVVLGPSGISVAASEVLSAGLAQELSAAMDEQFPNNSNLDGARQPPSPIPAPQSHPIKTSSSHPINISAIIPPELVALISSHMLFTSSTDLQTLSENAPHYTPPTILEVPSPFTLDRFIFSETNHCSHFRHQQANAMSRVTSPPTVPHPSAVTTTGVRQLRTRTHVTEALQAALNSGLKAATPIASVDREPLATFHSNTSSLSLSVSLKVATPPSEVVFRSTPEQNSPSQNKALPDIHADEGAGLMYAEPQGAVQLSTTHVRELASSNELVSAPPPFMLGNLFLSSCPGKKVRLQGPVKGRSGVCRDLFTDMQRMKELGIGCVVCCLDDTELEFLGAPWSEYQDVVNKIGIDVLRLPTPEGLSPSLSPAALNEELTLLIQNYTLRAVPILVHCRGGVGRAGVIACCWILKLGLCGWFGDGYSSPVTSTSTTLSISTVSFTDFSSDLSSSPISPTGTRLDTIQLVEKVIAVVRRRRSIKAVETYEQVEFLIDFVEYLRGCVDERT